MLESDTIKLYSLL